MLSACRYGLAALLVWATPVAWTAGDSVHSDRWTDEFDRHFKKYTKRYFGPHFDWHWFKAQAIAESGLKPDARSPRGARGVMQILPSTFDEIRKHSPYLMDVDSPRWNIAAGIYYDRKLYRKWRQPSLTNRERLYFAFGSYNAGFSRILKAYRKTDRPVTAWEHVARHVPRQTRHYVNRIRTLKADGAEQPTARRRHAGS